jgi:hypothetical protein
MHALSQNQITCAIVDVARTNVVIQQMTFREWFAIQICLTPTKINFISKRKILAFSFRFNVAFRQIVH